MAAPATPSAVPSLDIGAAVKDAAIVALIALGLAAPIMGLVTVQSAGAIRLEPHWMRVVIAVAVVFVGRLVLNLTLWAPKSGAKPTRLITPQVEAQLKTVGRYAGPAALAIAILLPFVPGVDRTMIDLGTLVLIYVMLGWGLNIVVGLAGLLDLGYVAFYAVGAYSYALLSTQFGVSFWLCLPLAGILAALWGVMLGFPVLRLRGDYLAIVTLAFGEIIRIVLLNWQWVTGGPNGIPNIPKPTFFGIDFTAGPGGFADTFGLTPSGIHRVVFMYYLILALALITNYVVLRLRRLPIGRAWEALREDEIACRSLGINTVNTKLTAFALGAMFAGFAGSFFATRQSLVSPESFTFIESALILAIVVLGGMGSQFGVALAALLLIGGFELFREFEDYRMMVFGLVMVLIMIWRPRGLVSSRTPSVFLKEKKAISGDLVQEGHG